MLVRLLVLVDAPIELAEAEVAVGDERAHAELAGERQRLLKMRPRRVGRRRISAGLSFAERPETLRPPTPLAAGASALKPMLGDSAGVTWTAGQEQRLALPDQVAAPAVRASRFALDRCLVKQAKPVLQASAACVCVAERAPERRHPIEDIQLAHEAEALLERRERGREVAARDSWEALAPQDPN